MIYLFRGWTLLAVCILLMPCYATAEFYQYKDADGNLVFTDDYSQVPENQRNQTQKYDSVKPAARLSDSESDGLESGKNASRPLIEPAKMQRQELEKEYKRLQEVRRLLMLEKEQVKTVEEQKSYNEKVNQLNQHINEFSEKINSFNQSVPP